MTLAELGGEQVVALLSAWQEQYRDLGARPEVNHVLMFENKGEVVGVSNPHPHCQIYATNFVFKTIENEAAISRRYWDENRRVLMEEIIAAEQADGRRILSQNDSADRLHSLFRPLRLRDLRGAQAGACEPGRPLRRRS